MAVDTGKFDAGTHFDRRFLARVAIEVRWSFHPPRHWLIGVFINLVLSIAYLAYQPLTGHGHRDWAVLVGIYFATFILADVTTTNVLGVDSDRVRSGLGLGHSIGRILLTKNMALLIIIGLPTLLLTAALEPVSRYEVTLPEVALPIMAWLGVGNIVSVLLPVATVTLMQRWHARRSIRSTSVWLFHLALPYALYYVVVPVNGVQRHILGTNQFRHINPDVRSLVDALTGLAIWLVGTAIASYIVRRRGLPSF